VARRYALRQKERLAAKYAQGQKTLLDVGTGTGYFLHTCLHKGWNAAATEPDPQARQQALRRSCQTPVFVDVFDPCLQDKRYQIITLWHVLEHIHSLDATLERLKQLLDKEGSLIVAVPNASSFDARWFGASWAAYDVPRHLYHFEPAQMQTLLQKHGLQIVAQKPMWLDAFYISLLSTRYQGGRTRPLMAFFIGLWSNWVGWRQKGNTSSLIYIIKHQ
jgi:2-polyprenyl-3-methyl-5-hydroxy-6-metoxy-1,4-benzoquinol methylase